MPLWAWCYFILVLGLAARDTQLRIREGDSTVYVLASGFSSVCSVAAIWAFWHPGFAALLGAALFITTLYALIWDCMTMKHDIRADTPAPQLSPRQNSAAIWLTTVVAFVLMLPAYYFGFMAAYAQIRGVPTV
jgi:O-antigen/teichoic acid export membrane protein